MRSERYMLIRWTAAVIVAALSWACSSTKHVPDGNYLVDDVRINVTDNPDIRSDELINYLRQVPNHKVLGFLKLQLATYNMAGSDSASGSCQPRIHGCRG